jgi:pimeloyl-ACP methyl ester carboxylesterase
VAGVRHADVSLGDVRLHVAEAGTGGDPVIRLLDRLLRQCVPDRTALSDDDIASYVAVLRDPARARASVALYRTFVLHEAWPAMRVGASRRLTVPATLVVGEHDPVATPALVPGFGPYADDMSVEVVPGCGHFIPEGRPDVVLGAVRQLTTRVP